jgi:hypothetical protein
MSDNLTVSLISCLKPKRTAYYEWDKSGERGAGRLGVKVEPSGQRVFYYRYFWQGKRQFILLGRFPELSLAQAKQQCKEHAGLLKEGKAPKSEIVEQLFTAEPQQYED